MFNYKRLLRVIDAGADTFEDYNSDEDLCFTTDSQPPTTGGNGEMATGGNPLTMRGNPIANSTMMTPGRNPEDWRATLARIDELEAALRGGARLFRGKT